MDWPPAAVVFTSGLVLGWLARSRFWMIQRLWADTFDLCVDVEPAFSSVVVRRVLWALGLGKTRFGQARGWDEPWTMAVDR